MSEPYTKEEIAGIRKFPLKRTVPADIAFDGKERVVDDETEVRWLATYDALLARVARLEEALRFYADEDSWREKADGEEASTCDVLEDGGAQASAALSSTAKVEEMLVRDAGARVLSQACRLVDEWPEGDDISAASMALSRLRTYVAAYRYLLAAERAASANRGWGEEAPRA